MKHSGWPTPQVVLSDSPDATTNNGDLIVDSSNHRRVYVISYRQSADDEDELLEFFHCYTVLKLDGGNFMVSFLTINLEDLPLEADAIDVIRNSVDERYTIAPGWMEMGNYNLMDKEYGQTELTLNFIINVSPTHLDRVQAYFMKSTEMISNIRKSYDRSLEVDNAVHSHFINVIMPKLKGLTEIENEALEECTKLLNWGSKETKWRKISGSKNDRIEKSQTDHEDETVSVMGVAKIDESAEMILSHILHTTSNERLKNHLQTNGHTERTCEIDYESHTSHFTTEIKAPKIMGARNRWFASYWVWDKGWKGDPNVYVIAILPVTMDAKVDLDSKTGGKVLAAATGVFSGFLQSSKLLKLTSDNQKAEVVVASTIAMFVIEPLAGRVSRVTQLQKTDLNLGDSKLSKMFGNYVAQYSLHILDKLLLKYERNGDLVDAELRGAFMNKLPLSARKLSGDHEKLIAKCLAIETAAGDFTEIKSNSHRIKYYQKYDPSIDASGATGKAVTELDSSAAEALAWRWAWTSNQKMRLHREDNRSVSRSMIKEDTSGNEAILETTKRFPFPFRSRQFIAKAVWSGPDSEGSYLYCWESTSDDVTNSSYVKATSIGFIKFKPIPGSLRSQFTMFQKNNVGGNVPVRVGNLTIRHSLITAAELHSTFDRDDEIDAENETN